MQKRLRMAGESLRGLAACADHRPRAIVEAAVETRKHDRALFAARNRRDERGGRAVGAGRACDDGRPAPGAGRERGDLGLDQERYALGSIDETVLGEPLWPMGEGDPEKVKGDAPIGVVAIRRQSFELPPVDALDDHVVDQRREVACERIGLRRGRSDQGGFVAVEHEPAVGVDAANCAAQRLAPGANEPRQRVAAGQFADGGRQPGGRRVFALGLEKRRRVVRLEGAERGDAGQEDALDAARREQRLGERPGGPLRRDVDRRARERQRTAGPGEAVDQFAVEQRTGERRQERRSRRNREDARIANRHDSLVPPGWGEGKATCGQRAFGSSAAERRREPLPLRFVCWNSES